MVNAGTRRRTSDSQITYVPAAQGLQCWTSSAQRIDLTPLLLAEVGGNIQILTVHYCGLRFIEATGLGRLRTGIKVQDLLAQVSAFTAP